MGVFDSKSNTSMADGSNSANTQTSDGSASLLPTITAGDDIKNMDLSMSVEEHHIDNSVDYSSITETNTDNSQYFEDNSDHSQYFEDNSDHSQYFEDNSDRSINGEFAGNAGTITVTDGGAFDLASEALYSQNQTVGLVADLTSQMMSENTALAMGANDNYANLVSEFGDTAAFMLDRTLASQDSYSQSALDTASIIAQQGNENNQQFLSEVGNAFKTSMQFVEDFSRSDSASISENQNKTLLALGAIVGVSLILYKKVS